MPRKTNGEKTRVVSNKSPKAGLNRRSKETPVHIDNEARMIEAIPPYNPFFSSSNRVEVERCLDNINCILNIERNMVK